MFILVQIKSFEYRFQVTASQMNPPGETLTQLILTDSEEERIKWVGALQELHKMLKRNQETSKMVIIIVIIIIIIIIIM